LSTTIAEIKLSSQFVAVCVGNRGKLLSTLSSLKLFKNVSLLQRGLRLGRRLQRDDGGAAGSVDRQSRTELEEGRGASPLLKDPPPPS